MSVRLSVCLSVCSPHNSKTNDPKASKLGIGMALGYPRSGMALNVKMSKVKVTGSISAFYNNDYYGASMLMQIRLTIVKRCVDE